MKALNSEMLKFVCIRSYRGLSTPGLDQVPQIEYCPCPAAMESELRFPWEWNFSHVSLVQVQRYAEGLWMLYGQGIPRVLQDVSRWSAEKLGRLVCGGKEARLLSKFSILALSE